MARIIAIIPAAGSGLRLGGPLPKQFLSIQNIPILALTLLNFERVQEVEQVILVYHPDWKKKVISLIQEYNLEKVYPLVAGGKTRQESVYNGFREVSSDCEIVLVHDGVRPFVKPVLIRKCISACSEFDGAILAVPVKDTIKEEDGGGRIRGTLPRERLWQAQTPQVFRREVLGKALNKAVKDGFQGTDEASLVERIGGRILLVKGDDLNIKITTPDDLILARSIFPTFTAAEDLSFSKTEEYTREN